MKINDYNAGDDVEVLMNNPRNHNKDEWRAGKIIDKRLIYPSGLGTSRPYPILIVRVRRTFCKATPTYRWIDTNIPIFVDNKLEFYDKENDEGFFYEDYIRLKQS